MNKIALHGVPRSGTTWVGAIFDSSVNVAYRHQPLFSYEFKSFLSEKSTLENIDDFFLRIKNTNDDFVLQKDSKLKATIPTFQKEKITHIVYKEARYHNILNNLLEKDSEIKVVGIIRNPKSVISSWYNAPREFKKKEWDILTEWVNADLKNEQHDEEFYGYNKWKEVSNMFLKLKEKYPKRFFLIEYKELITKPEEIIQKLFDFCEIELSEQTTQFLSLSQKKDLSNDAYSVYRSKQTDDKWKTNLPKEIIKAIDNDLKGAELEKFLD